MKGDFGTFEVKTATVWVSIEVESGGFLIRSEFTLTDFSALKGPRIWRGHTNFIFQRTVLFVRTR